MIKDDEHHQTYPQQVPSAPPTYDEAMFGSRNQMNTQFAQTYSHPPPAGNLDLKKFSNGTKFRISFKVIVKFNRQFNTNLSNSDMSNFFRLNLGAHPLSGSTGPIVS